MKTTLQAALLAVTLLIGLDLSAQYSPFEFGIKVGANLSDYTGKGPVTPRLNLDSMQG